VEIPDVPPHVRDHIFTREPVCYRVDSVAVILVKVSDVRPFEVLYAPATIPQFPAESNVFP